jgi:hypothetical protein
MRRRVDGSSIDVAGCLKPRCEIIRHAVWLYLRFTLRYWDVEDL